jgi:uncharacterized protein (DUF934 family)
MPTLIKDGRVAADTWHFAEDAMPGTAAPTVLPLAQWRERRDALGGAAARWGVLLEPGDDPATIATDLPALGLVAVRFPAFTDGRGYSTARLVRQRYGFCGELRAVGDVLRDQIFLLARCGFDAFALRDDQDAAAAIAALSDFSEAYQAAVDRGPLFERRFAVRGVHS